MAIRSAAVLAASLCLFVGPSHRGFSGHCLCRWWLVERQLSTKKRALSAVSTNEDGNMTRPATGFLRAIVAGGLLLLSGHAATALAVTISVCPTGCNYTTITEGLSNATLIDTVVVGTPGRTTPETYYENVVLLNGINLVSQGDDTTTAYTDTLGGTGYSTTVLKRATLTVIHGAGFGAVVTFPFEQPNNGLLDGFTVENISEGADAYTGLILVGGSSPTIKNNIIRNNRGSQGYNGGIMMAGPSSTITPLIERNVIHYTNGPGVGIRDGANPTIINNDIFTTPPSAPTHAPGIGLTGAASATILNNRLFKNGRAGVGSMNYEPGSGITETGIPIVIKGNYIHNNPTDNTYGAGVRLTGSGTWSQTGAPQVVIGGPLPSDGNQFSSNKAGVYLDHVTTYERFGSAVIENNDFQGNRVAVRAERMHSLSIINNDMYSQIEFCAIRTENVNIITIDGNEMRDNAKCGVRVFDSPASESELRIQNNNIYQNAFGGLVLGDVGMWGTVSGNHIHQSGLGGILIGASTSADAGSGGLGILNNEINHNVRGGLHTGGLSLVAMSFLGNPGSAMLTIKGNKVHHNGQGNLGGGLDVRHAAGSIENNLVYKNNMGGIRYNDGTECIVDGGTPVCTRYGDGGITKITQNTVVSNGLSGAGAGIVYDNYLGLSLSHEPPRGSPTVPVADIKNNILVGNKNAGVNAGTVWSGGATCPDHVGHRQYNLYSANNGRPASIPQPPMPFNTRPQLGMCNPNTGERFFPPGFVDATNDNYHLLLTSPAVDTGDPALPDDIIPPGMGDAGAPDMGAYGGPNGIMW